MAILSPNPGCSASDAMPVFLTLKILEYKLNIEILIIHDCITYLMACRYLMGDYCYIGKTRECIETSQQFENCKNRETYVKCDRYIEQFAIDNPDHKLKETLMAEIGKVRNEIQRIEALLRASDVRAEHLRKDVNLIKKKFKENEDFLNKNQ
jgi:hypothetical protein